jgi:type VI protein secretion system component Hcp
MNMRRWTRNRVVFVSAAVVVAAGLGLAGADAASAEGTGQRAPVRVDGVTAAAAAPGATVRGGVVLDGIAGEGTAIAGGIDVVNFSDAVNAPVSSGGGGVGRPTLTDLQLSGVLDAAYPALFQNATTGRHLRTAVLTGCTDVKKCAATAYVEVDLADAVVTHVAIGGDRQVEFSLAFRQITWKFLRNGAVVSQSQFDVSKGTA